MQHWVVFKKLVKKCRMLWTHGSLEDKQKLCVNVKQLMNCTKNFQKKFRFLLNHFREQLRLQAKRKGLTTCLIRDAGLILFSVWK
jgi:hypothetical protein